MITDIDERYFDVELPSAIPIIGLSNNYIYIKARYADRKYSINGTDEAYQNLGENDKKEYNRQIGGDVMRKFLKARYEHRGKVEKAEVEKTNRILRRLNFQRANWVQYAESLIYKLIDFPKTFEQMRFFENRNVRIHVFGETAIQRMCRMDEVESVKTRIVKIHEVSELVDISTIGDCFELQSTSKVLLEMSDERRTILQSAMTIRIRQGKVVTIACKLTDLRTRDIISARAITRDRLHVAVSLGEHVDWAFKLDEDLMVKFINTLKDVRDKPVDCRVEKKLLEKNRLDAFDMEFEDSTFNVLGIDQDDEDNTKDYVEVSSGEDS
jgi:hypothetical protein